MSVRWVTRLLSALLVMVVTQNIASAQTIGPVYPPPLGVTLTSTDPGSANGSISRSGGVTLTFSALSLPGETVTWWGAQPGGVQQSFDGNSNPAPFTYATSTANSIQYVGATSFIGGPNVYLRFTMMFAGAGTVVSAATAGVNPSVGAVYQLAAGQSGFQANMLFEASYDGNNWAPSLDVYDAQPGKPAGSALSSFNGGFYYLPYVDLSVSLSNAMSYLPGGGIAQYTIVVQNAGIQDATGATVTDTLPANFSADSWTCVASGVAGGTCAASGSGAMNDTVNVPVGAILTYTVTASVDPLPEQPTTYSVQVRTPIGATEVHQTDNTADDTAMVKIFADGFE